MLTPLGVDPALVLEIEEQAFRAWPAEEVEELDGWRLRFNGGVTGRANSVWPNVDGGALSLPEKLERVEAEYAGRGLPAKFQVCPAAQPRELDTILTKRGYGPKEATTCVDWGPIQPLLSGLSAGTGVVRLTERMTEDWFSAYASAEAFPAGQETIRRDIIQRIGTRTGFAMAERNRAPVSVALGVLDGDWLGLFCVSTHPEHRRQSLARTTLRALLQWGADHGATLTYLQVMENNVPARRLYGQAGYVVAYRYHYRTLPQR